MAQAMTRTCWRGMQVDHPPTWELTVASGLNEPRRCSFADRRYKRLDICWKPIRHVPNLDLLLDKYRRKAEKAGNLSDLVAAPPEWRGVIRKTETGLIVHAGRFFREVRRLVEATIVWPARRDREIENGVLSSITPQDPRAAVRQWRAMGLDLTVGGGMDLIDSNAQVGRVRWDFADSKDRSSLTVERIAMPEVWLKVPLRDWLAEEAGPRATVLEQSLINWNGHRGEMLLARRSTGIFSLLRGLRRLSMDLAWLCPVEDRVYRVVFTKLARQGRIARPDNLKVRCCQAPPEPIAGP